MLNSKQRRWTAGIAIIAILLVMLFSTIYITQHLDHDCCGSDCQVCAVLEQCVHNINGMGTLVMVAATGFVLFFSEQREMPRKEAVVVCSSLISQKVRLNN